MRNVRVARHSKQPPEVQLIVELRGRVEKLEDQLNKMVNKYVDAIDDALIFDGLSFDVTGAIISKLGDKTEAYYIDLSLRALVPTKRKLVAVQDDRLKTVRLVG